jgi:perosamine synthetase
MIPVFKPSITQKEISAVIKVLKSGWLGLGPKTEEFEKKFSQYIGARFAVGLNSGTSALHLALNVLGIKRGDEVIVPTITFVSTAHAVLYNQAKPVFADVDPDTLCIDPQDIKKKITSKTKAIIPVHYSGHPADLDKIYEIVKKKNIEIIEDAAHACGAEYKGRKIGSISRLTCFSFHAVKNLTCGEGGMITTNDDELYRKLKELRWLGISKDTWTRSELGKIYAWQYWVNELGFKAHLNDLASAIGLVQLSRLEDLNKKRRMIVNIYNKRLENLKHIKLPIEKKDVKSSWHIYHIKLKKRDELIAFLKDKGIAPGVHYYPIHLHPYYRKRYYSYCPVAEYIWKQLISLPLYPDMTQTEITRVTDAIKQFSVQADWEETEIKGNKIILRNIQSSDLDMMLEWRNQNRRYFFDSSILTKDRHQEWFDNYLKDNRTDKMFIIETKNKIPIGMIGLNRIDYKNKCAEFGRFIIGIPKFRKRGFGSDAARTLVKFAFNKLGLRRIYLRLLKKNKRAKKLYQRIGFIEEGLDKEIKVDQRIKRDIIQMAMLK